MSNKLVIRWQQTTLTADTTLDWCLLDDSGNCVEQGQTVLAELAAQMPSAELHAIVPADPVLLTSADIPSRQIRQVRQALPFMIEEQLAEDIDDVHLAIPLPLPAEGEIPVAVIRHQLMVSWLDVLISHGLRVMSMVPETLLLPFKPATVTLLLERDRALLRHGDFAGLALNLQSSDLLAALVQQVRSEQIPPALVEVISCEPSLPADLEQIIASVQASEDSLQHTRYHETPLQVLLSQWSAVPTINLLQGGYDVKRQQRDNTKSWRRAGLLAAAATVCYFSVTLGSGLFWQWRADAIEQDSVQLYKQIFPNQQRVISPRRQLESQLGSMTATGNSRFLPLLADIAPAFGADYQLNQLRYDPAREGVQMEIQTGSIDQLDQLKQALDQLGLIVAINSAAEQDQYVVGKLLVSYQ